MTLLEKALAVPPKNRRRRTRSKEELELAVAWAAGRITTTQAIKVLGIPKTSRGAIYNFMASVLQQAVKTGYLVVAKRVSRRRQPL